MSVLIYATLKSKCKIRCCCGFVDILGPCWFSAHEAAPGSGLPRGPHRSPRRSSGLLCWARPLMGRAGPGSCRGTPGLHSVPIDPDPPRGHRGSPFALTSTGLTPPKNGLSHSKKKKILVKKIIREIILDRA